MPRLPLRRNSVAAALILAALTLSSCAALSPYESSYSCDKIGKGYGKCQDLESTYKASLQEAPSASAFTLSSDGLDPKEVQEVRKKIVEGKKLTQEEAETMSSYVEGLSQKARARSTVNEYEKEKIKVGASLLRKSEKPLRSPDKILRVLVLPYVTDEGTLNEYRHVYFKADDGDWLIGEELSPKNKTLFDANTMSPLSTPSGEEKRSAPAKFSVPPAQQQTGAVPGAKSGGFNPPPAARQKNPTPMPAPSGSTSPPPGVPSVLPAGVPPPSSVPPPISQPGGRPQTPAYQAMPPVPQQGQGGKPQGLPDDIGSLE